MKTPKEQADEKAMDIACEIKQQYEVGTVSSFCDESDFDYATSDELAKLISTHLLPLYECVEALRKHHAHHSEKCEVFFPKDNFTYVDVDNETTLMPTDLGEAYQESGLCEETCKALASLTTPTPRKKE